MLTFTQVADQFSSILVIGERYWMITFGVCAFLIVIHFLNATSGRKLNFLGVIPRHIWGLPGIICSPFLHGDSGHLIFNLFPLFILMNLMLFQGLDAFIFISCVFIVATGLLTWLFAKKAIHIGASSVILAYWGFLLMSSFAGFSIVTVLVVFICLYFFGNFIFSIVPQGDNTSWEGHLFGLIVGVAFGYGWFVEKGRPIKEILNWVTLHLLGHPVA